MLVKRLLRPMIPAFARNFRRRRATRRFAAGYGFSLRYADEYIQLARGRQVLRLGYAQEIYLRDCISFFDFYFNSVKPTGGPDLLLTDFSGPRYHKVPGFGSFPLLFPSIPEPHETVEQYLQFARLRPGDVVFDLGVYAGLTTLEFSRQVGPRGKVYGFEADEANFAAASENVETHRGFGGADNVTLIPKAVWSHDDGLAFSSEGAMGSGAVAVLGSKRGKVVQAPTTTLSSFCREHQIGRLDFIKMDVEGAEIEILESSRKLLPEFKPRLVIEPHMVGAGLTTERCCAILKEIGYRAHLVTQNGASVPLIEAEWDGVSEP